LAQLFDRSLLQFLARIDAYWSWSRRNTVTIIVTVCSATATALPPPLFATVMPSSPRACLSSRSVPAEKT
jgi:hypothetical protein